MMKKACIQALGLTLLADAAWAQEPAKRHTLGAPETYDVAAFAPLQAHMKALKDKLIRGK